MRIMMITMIHWSGYKKLFKEKTPSVGLLGSVSAQRVINFNPLRNIASFMKCKQYSIYNNTRSIAELLFIVAIVEYVT